MSSLLGEYKSLLMAFISNGYSGVEFKCPIQDERQLLLRHDIDIDVQLAHEMAKIEHGLNIKSTYFFMLTNPLYNLMERENFFRVNEIKEVGHTISLHFDTTCYYNKESGFFQEKAIF